MFVAMTVREGSQYIIQHLKTICSEGEATAISRLVLENLTGGTASPKETELTPEQEATLKKILQRLTAHEPVQYILNESWFCGLKFYVDKNVLIPRPETEELVEWIISNCKFPVDELTILDIGTGSGCIPIALKRRIRKAVVWSCDISDAALTVAKKNAPSLGTAINFVQLDFLDQSTWSQLPSFDIIVSNPPYVPERDKESMQPNVLDYEPHTALFVPDNDALIFYKAIAEFGKLHLHKGGTVYLEIHESLGEATTAIFRSAGYHTELKKDMQGKDRMVKAVLG